MQQVNSKEAFVEEYNKPFLECNAPLVGSEHSGKMIRRNRRDGHSPRTRFYWPSCTILLCSILLVLTTVKSASSNEDAEVVSFWDLVLAGRSFASNDLKHTSKRGGANISGNNFGPYQIASTAQYSDNTPTADASALRSDSPPQWRTSIWEILGLEPRQNLPSGQDDEISTNEMPDHGPQDQGLVKDLPVLADIPPLYTSPPLPDEGVWQSAGLPTDKNGNPLMYKTVYRPSEQYPNAIVYMLLFDMKRVSMRLFLGSSEPGATPGSSIVQPEDRNNLVAITNALWKQKHSGQAGTIFSSRVIKNLFPGMATLVIYNDSSVDIIEWSPDIPLEYVNDAKQLRHLIVKDGQVVSTISVNGRASDSEIGLGYLLSESEPLTGQYWSGWWGQPSYNTTSGPDWFIATRSAFGIRNDGNLVFAVGHHISTKDLAKALVLAGCQRAIHGDANPHNVVGNIYFPDGNGRFSRKEKLSAEQKTYTLDRYVDRSYTSDFFAFFRREH